MKFDWTYNVKALDTNTDSEEVPEGDDVSLLICLFISAPEKKKLTPCQKLS